MRRPVALKKNLSKCRTYRATQHLEGEGNLCRLEEAEDGFAGDEDAGLYCRLVDVE